jgi:hypothetical protein
LDCFDSEFSGRHITANILKVLIDNQQNSAWLEAELITVGKQTGED